MKSTLIRRIEVIEQNNNEVDQYIELQAQIDSLPIEDPLSLNEFLNPESETIVDENTDIFETVVTHYNIEKEGEESEESDGEKEPIMLVTEALRCLEVI
jgi:tRNA A22 N-methylase